MKMFEKKLNGRYLKIPYYHEVVPEGCSLVEQPDGWVSEVLDGELERMCCYRPILIAAPTGGGKTTFTQDVVRHCWKVTPTKKVLLLVSRKAIALQQKRELVKALGSRWRNVYDAAALDYTETFDDIALTIMTYQAFAARYKSMDLAAYGWVLYDEIHMFYSDALFNARLDALFWKFPKLFSHACRIYLSATPERIASLLCEAEKENMEQCYRCGNQWQCGAERAGKLVVHWFPKHYDRVRLRYFRDREEIVDLIKRSGDEKFMIFTSKCEGENTNEAGAYVRLLRDAGISYEYLDSGQKGSEVWEQVCAKGKFEAQVLVCTSVLDCGVNIKDAKMRHIVVETTDKVEFLQMVGRKRLQKGEQVFVYVRGLGRGEVWRDLRCVQDDLRTLDEGESFIGAGESDRVLYRGWMDEDADNPQRRLFNYVGGGRVTCKQTARNYLRWREAGLKQLLRYAEQYGDKVALPLMAHGWLLDLDGYDPKNWLDYEDKMKLREELNALLEEHLGQEFEGAKPLPLCLNISEKLDAFSERHHANTREILGVVALNRQFELLGIPFEFVKLAQKSGKQRYVLKERG